MDFTWLNLIEPSADNQISMGEFCRHLSNTNINMWMNLEISFHGVTLTHHIPGFLGVTHVPHHALSKIPTENDPLVTFPEGTHSLVNTQKTMENHHFNREINYKWTMASTMLVYQRLYLSSLLGESYELLLGKIHGSCPKPCGLDNPVDIAWPPCSWALVSVLNLFERQIPICIPSGKLT